MIIKNLLLSLLYQIQWRAIEMKTNIRTWLEKRKTRKEMRRRFMALKQEFSDSNTKDGKHICLHLERIKNVKPGATGEKLIMLTVRLLETNRAEFVALIVKVAQKDSQALIEKLIEMSDQGL
jgi:hypothetical protein